jgi:hypothetical protein
MKITFRGITIKIDNEKLKEDTLDADFNGQYLIQFKTVNNKKIAPTGLGIDGGGYPLEFSPEEFTIEYDDEKGDM